MSAPRPSVTRPLLDAVEVLRAAGAQPRAIGDLSGQIRGVTLDSRSVQPGDLFAALPGEHAHGAQFAEQAAALGAAAILTDEAGATRCSSLGLPVIVIDDPRARLGEFSAWVYGYPARELRIVGITGTNGKTTMTYLLEAAFRQLGLRSAIIGTTGTHIGDERIETVRTTPESPDLHALLAVMRERGVEVVAMEISSHSLVLGRVDGLHIDVACFTHLTQDHLDFHSDMESYFSAKARLFTPLHATTAVIGLDDEWGRRLAAQSSIPFVTYAREHADWIVTEVANYAGNQSVHARGPHGPIAFELGLPGDFNVINALGAVACLERLGLDAAAGAAGFRDLRVPGRMERVDVGQDFLAVVDYAHSPDAVRRVLASIDAATTGRVIAVLGCGGDRDREKRPLMGTAAAEGADVVIVTDDNPRSEVPAEIRAAVLAGIRAVDSPRALDIREIAQRSEAIAVAISLAGPGDAVAVLGKGHETGQEIAGVVTAFDDRLEIASAIGRSA